MGGSLPAKARFAMYCLHDILRWLFLKRVGFPAHAALALSRVMYIFLLFRMLSFVYPFVEPFPIPNSI